MIEAVGILNDASKFISSKKLEFSPDSPTFQLLRFGEIAGSHYPGSQSSDILVIYGIGAPRVPDCGDLPDAQTILKHNIDIYVPDYLGNGRSDGIFTPTNCIKTFVDLNSAFKSGTVGKNASKRIEMPFQYKRIIFIGRSFGAIYIPVLPRFDNTIQELAVLSPVLNTKSQGSEKDEESAEDFLRSMERDGYHHLYRGVLSKEWRKHLRNEDDLSPIDNLLCLQNSRLFIGHGMKDPVIHYSKSIEFYNKLIEQFPERTEQFRIQLYPEGDHGKRTTNLAIEDFLEWIKVDA